MDFFNKHMNSSVISTPDNHSRLASKEMEIPRFREFQTPLPAAPMSFKRDLPPLAESTPLPPAGNSVIKRSGLLDTSLPIVKKPLQSSLTAIKQVQSNIGVSSSEEISSPNLNQSVDAGPDASNHDSPESQMTALYENLQAEAQKIQKFKVQAVAQIKQKSDEISMKASQVKQLSLELSTTKSTNAHLSSKLQRQKFMNDEVMNKVAITREMCFSLAEEHITLKDLINVGKEIFAETKRKSSSHSISVKKKLDCVEQFKASTDVRLHRIEEMAQAKDIEQRRLLEEGAKKEKHLLEQVADRDTSINQLQIKSDENLNEILLLKERVADEKDAAQLREAELTAAIEELSLSKQSELSALQRNLEETIANNTSSEEQWLKEVECLKQQLFACQLSLNTMEDDLKTELATRQEVTREKALCEEQLAEKEVSISELTLTLSDVELRMKSCDEKLNEKSKRLEETRLELEQVQVTSAELTGKLKETVKELVDEMEVQKADGDELKSELIKVENTHRLLQLSCESLRTTHEFTSKLLAAAEGEIGVKNGLLSANDEEIKVIKEKLEKVSLDADVKQSSLKQSLEKLQEESKMEQESKLEEISGLELKLKEANAKIDELQEKHREAVSSSEEELSTLTQTMKTQQQDFECTAKQKTEAFNKVQNEMQRVLDETISTNKERIFALTTEMDARQRQFEVEIEEKTDVFTQSQNEMQDMISELEKNFELETHRNDDLTQDLDITKQSLMKSLEDKNTVAIALAQKTQEHQDVTNKLLVKECEFSKLMTAVQNLKSRWAAVATPMTPASTPIQQIIAPQQAAVKPTSHTGTPQTPSKSFNPSTPSKSATPTRRAAGMTTPKRSTAAHNTTPRSAGSIRAPSGYGTPRTPNSCLESTKGILRGEGSASKPNRVVFRTPLEQRNVVPSDSETSVLDMAAVNRSLQISTPESERKTASIFRTGSDGNSSLLSKHSSGTPNKRFSGTPRIAAAVPNQTNVGSVTSSGQKLDSSVSPAVSSQGGGERLPRSKMIKANNRKRIKLTEAEGKSEEGALTTKVMKKHRELMELGKLKSSAMLVKESDSDCFGFGSE